MAANKHEDLAEVIAQGINKENKDGKIAFFLGQDETAADVREFISTQSSLLDLAISNRPHGGIAVGRITEISGLEGAGKSLLAMHLIAETQRKGGIAVLLDSEAALSEEFATAVGVDLKKLVYVQAFLVEEIFTAIANVIESVRKTDKNKLVLIVVDSIAAATTQKELEADFTRQGYNTDKSLLLGMGLRKLTGVIGEQRIALVLTNQLRMKLDAMAFSDKYITPGGKAIGFACSTRLRLTLTEKIKKKPEDTIIGVQVKAQVTKSRLGPPHRIAEFPIFYDRGIDDASSIFDFLKEHDIITKSGAPGNYAIEVDGKTEKFAGKEWSTFYSADPARKEVIYQMLCERMVSAYKSEGAETEHEAVPEGTEE